MPSRRRSTRTSTPFAPCTSPYAYDLPNGEHVFEVRATTLPLDGRACSRARPREYEWTIDAADTTDPDTTHPARPGRASTTNTSATFLFSGTDNLTAPADLTFECSLDGAAFAACASGTSTPVSRRPAHLRVRAIDTPPRRTSTSRRRRTRGRSWLRARTTRRRARTSRSSVGGATHHLRRGHGGRRHLGRHADRGRRADLPRGYFTAGALYYDVSTTATFVGDVTVCLPYGTLADAHVLHFDGGVGRRHPRAAGRPGLRRRQQPVAVRGRRGSAEVAPETTIVQAPADPTIQSTGDGADVQFQFASTIDTVERPAEFECRLDAEPWSSLRHAVPVQRAVRRAHAPRPRDDRHRRPRRCARVHTWTVLARPVATIDSGPVDEDPSTPDIENESRTATFQFSSDQAGSTFECRLTGEATGSSWETCTSPQSYKDLALGEYTFEVQAIKAGHASFLPAQFEWEVADLTPPVVTIDRAARPAPSTRPRRRSSSRPTSRPPSSARSTARRSAVLPAPAPLHRLRPRRAHVPSAPPISPRARTSSEPATRTWTVADLTAPTIDLSEKPPATTSEHDGPVHLHASDNWPGAITIDCRLDGSAFVACTSPTTYSGLSAAAHTFDVRATDPAGNARRRATPGRCEDVVVRRRTSRRHDRLADLRVHGHRRPHGRRRPRVRVPPRRRRLRRVHQPEDVHRRRPGGDDAGRPHLPGPRDRRGRQRRQPDSHTFTVADTTAPDTPITGQPDATTTNTDATFAFTGSDDGTAPASLTFECKLDLGRSQPCTSAKSYTGLAVGPHTFQVRATDAAGNIDQIAGELHVDGPGAAAGHDGAGDDDQREPPATTTETNASFSFAGTDNVTAAGSLTFECKLDTGAWAACTTPKAYTGLAIGPHTFSVRAKDAAGNIDRRPRPTRGRSRARPSTAATADPDGHGDAWIDSGSPRRTRARTRS